MISKDLREVIVGIFVLIFRPFYQTVCPLSSLCMAAAFLLVWPILSVRLLSLSTDFSPLSGFWWELDVTNNTILYSLPMRSATVSWSILFLYVSFFIAPTQIDASYESVEFTITQNIWHFALRNIYRFLITLDSCVSFLSALFASSSSNCALELPIIMLKYFTARFEAV